ncbi:MAG: hypothetical protein WCI77_02880 [Candidatus Omnitrophota bacterium]
MGFFNFFKSFIGRKKKKKLKKRKKITPRKPAKTKKKPRRRVLPRIKKTHKSKPAKVRTKSKVRARKKRGAPKRKKFKVSAKKSLPISNEKAIGTITHFFGHISVGIIKLSSPLATGATIHIKGSHDDFTQVVSSMQYDHRDITYAKRGLEIGIKVIKPVHENDIVYMVG